MQDKTIDNALLALRKQIIRWNLDGLAHVETLLGMRGVAMPAVLPPKKADAARRGQMRLLVLETLRDGPKPLCEVAAHVAARRPELPPDAAHRRTELCLGKMRAAGLVARVGRIWQLY